jgi:hypothetical protein
LKHQVHCKHILFVFLKVLKLPDPLWYQAAFLTSVKNAKGMFADAIGTPRDFYKGGG